MDGNKNLKRLECLFIIADNSPPPVKEWSYILKRILMNVPDVETSIYPQDSTHYLDIVCRAILDMSAFTQGLHVMGSFST